MSDLNFLKPGLSILEKEVQQPSACKELCVIVPNVHQIDFSKRIALNSPNQIQKFLGDWEDLEQKNIIDYYDKFKTIHFGSKNIKFKQVFLETVRVLPNRAFYFLDVERLKNTAEIFLTHFQQKVQKVIPNTFLSYALKVNPLPEIIRILGASGIEVFDCASIGEVNRINCLVPDAKKYLNNCALNESHVKNSSWKGVTQFTVDEINNIRKVINAYQGNKEDLLVAIRFKAEKSNAKIDLSENFGQKLSTALRLLENIENFRLKTGVAMHIGSQNECSSAHVYSSKAIINELLRNGKRIDLFNYGGGIPVYHELSYEENTNIALKYLDELTNSIIGCVEKVMAPNGVILLEPGRGLIGPAVDLVIPILNLKVAEPVSELTIADGIFNSFSDAVIHGWKYPMRVLNSNGNEVKGKTRKFIVKGQSCDGGDVITYEQDDRRIMHIDLPECICRDHYVWIPNAGAYMSSQSSEFNGFGMHPYIIYNS